MTRGKRATEADPRRAPVRAPAEIIVVRGNYNTGD